LVVALNGNDGRTKITAYKRAYTALAFNERSKSGSADGYVKDGEHTLSIIVSAKAPKGHLVIFCNSACAVKTRLSRRSAAVGCVAVTA
jgi:hypothetical protein